MSKRISEDLRRRWTAIIESEGARLGLSGCKSFLENKLVNDIFYDGVFKGRPCIVKCSSRAPFSILNEYKLLKRLEDDGQMYFPRAFACHITDDHNFAFVVVEKIVDIGTIEPRTALEDVKNIIAILREKGIVHRDVNRANLFFAADGHLRLIDFQFAIDRASPQEDPWMRRNWKYLLVVFSRMEKLPPATWNDIAAFRSFIQRYKECPTFTEIDAWLEAFEADGNFTTPVSSSILPSMLCYCMSLWLQIMFRRRREIRERLRRRERVVRRTMSAIMSKSLHLGGANDDK